MQSASSRIWTRVAVSISYDDNHYTTNMRTQCGSDYPSTTQMVSHMIVSRWLVHSVWRSRWCVFMEEGESIMLEVQYIYIFLFLLEKSKIL